MPSPIAHAAAGYAVYKVYAARYPQRDLSRIGPVPRLLLLTVSLSLLPDLDVIPGLIFGALDKFHNNISHSLVCGLLAALAIGLIAWLRDQTDFAFWIGLALICYELHIVMDYFTVGRGVMILWPFSLERYQPPLMLFYGLHRSDGWLSIRHFWTFSSEILFTLIVVISSKVWHKSKNQKYGRS